MDGYQQQLARDMQLVAENGTRPEVWIGEKLMTPDEIARLHKAAEGVRGQIPAVETKPASAFDEQVGGSHYKNMAIQPADFITANRIEFLEGCVIKRMCRWRKAGGIKDLEKAIHEIRLLIAAQSLRRAGDGTED